MGGPSPPKAGDVAATQEAYNKRAADYALSLSKDAANYQFGLGKQGGIFQNELNQVNQVTPTGSLTYQVIGHNKDGSPITRATTRLTPAQQALLNQQTDTNTTTARTAGNIIEDNANRWRAGPNLGPTANETGITKAIMGWGHDYLDPIFSADNASEDARLANQGIAPGSEAYTKAKMDRSRNVNDAYTKLLMEGQGQALAAQDMNMRRGEMAYMDPLKAISTLATGQQPSVNFAQTPQAGVAAPGVSSPGVSPTDYTAAANNQYNAKKANSDALMGGLFKIPQTILGGWASGGL